MKALKTQRRLAAELLNVGENKVVFDALRLEDISKAITRADIIDLIKDRAIRKKAGIRPINKNKKKGMRRMGVGSSKLRVKNRKAKYMAKIRKLRRYIAELRSKKVIAMEDFKELRKLSKSGQFKTRRHLKEYVANVMKKILPDGNKK